MHARHVGFETTNCKVAGQLGVAVVRPSVSHQVTEVVQRHQNKRRKVHIIKGGAIGHIVNVAQQLTGQVFANGDFIGRWDP